MSGVVAGLFSLALCLPAHSQTPQADTLARIALPYGNSIEKTLSTGSTSAYCEDDFNKMPTLDLRNSLTGVIPGLVVVEKSGATGLMYGTESLRTAMSVRGLSPEIIVDGIPMRITEIQIDPEEIESISLVKDVVDKSLFGSRSSNGVLYITTKRGVPAGRSIKVGVESGVDIIDRFPGYVSTSDYARLQTQARENAGYPVEWDETDFEAFAQSGPDDLIYPNINWRDLMFKNTKNYQRANLSVSGGEGSVRYFAYLGYAGEGDFFKAGSTADYNRANARASLDAAITRDLKFNLGMFAGVSFRRSPRYTDASFNEFANALTDANTVPGSAYPLHLGINTETGDQIYGVSQQYGYNPYAALLEGGFMTERGRSGVINATLSWDMHKFVKGLKFESNIGLNVYNQDRIGKKEDYLAMLYDPLTDTMSKTAHEGAKASGKSVMAKWYHQGLFVNERLSYSLDRGGHKLSAAATFALENTDRSGSSYREHQLSFIVNADYSYLRRYLLQLVVNTAGSSSFAPGKRWGVFPSAGLGWVVSEESALKDLSWLNYLKLRAQAGVIGYNYWGAQDLYEDEYTKSKGVNFGPASTEFEWIGGSTRYQSYQTTLARLGNKDLTWERRNELTVGIETRLFGDRLSLEANYYDVVRKGIITNTSSVLPYVYGMDGVVTYDNYNEIRYYGAELSAGWTDRVGEFEYSVRGWLTTPRGKYLKYSESELNEYNRTEGSNLGDYHGYRYIGKFESQKDIDSSPVQMLGSDVQPGDLKYKDMNGDGRIDSNDRTIIGNTTPKYNYSLSLNLKYRKFDLTVLGTGRAGFSTAMTNAYFWNGWGYGNYSNFVKDNIGGAYPRLSYDKIVNNFVGSNFWFRKGDWFKIQNVELGFTTTFARSKWIRGLRVFLRGGNLLTISGIKDVDPECTDAGVSADPLYRTFTGGVKLNF